MSPNKEGKSKLLDNVTTEEALKPRRIFVRLQTIFSALTDKVPVGGAEAGRLQLQRIFHKDGGRRGRTQGGRGLGGGGGVEESSLAPLRHSGL